MESLWVICSVVAGFGQALGWALKKKVLANKGINNTLGLVAYTTAGIIFLFWWGSTNSFLLPPITMRFIWATFIVCSLNVFASWIAYKVLDQSALSKLLPFISLTSLAIVPIEYFIRGVVPTFLQVLGIGIVVVGAIAIGAKEKIGKAEIKVAKYFGVALLCYAVTSAFMGVMVEESGSGLFSGVVAHFGIALGFIPLVVFSQEKTTVQTLIVSHEWWKVLFFMILAGLVIALLENGPVNIALETANAGEVFALKRSMPFFALVLGVMMFNEKITFRHVVGTTFLVLGSVLVILFQQ